MGPLQRGPGEGVEDPAARAALEVHHGGAMAAVGPQAFPLSAPRASRAVGVEQFDQFGEAGVLIQIIDQREVHGQDLQATGGIPLEDNHRTERSSRGAAPDSPHEPEEIIDLWYVMGTVARYLLLAIISVVVLIIIELYLMGARGA
jgi:hypothetical protein